MKSKIILVATIATAVSSATFAATDGVLSDVTSVGTFTNTFGTSVANGRKVQVLLLKDAAVTKDTPKLTSEGSTDFPGIRDNFCVVDNAAGTVRIKFTNTNGEGEWVAKSIAGLKLPYRLTFAPTPTGALAYVPINGVIEYASQVTEAGQCLSGNVSKGIVANQTMITDVTYSDTVVIAVSPK